MNKIHCQLIYKNKCSKECYKHSFYIDKFIIIEKKKIFNIVKKQINDEEMKKRKRFIRKQSTYKINVRQNKTIHHQLII